MFLPALLLQLHSLCSLPPPALTHLMCIFFSARLTSRKYFTILGNLAENLKCWKFCLQLFMFFFNHKLISQKKLMKNVICSWRSRKATISGPFEMRLFRHTNCSQDQLSCSLVLLFVYSSFWIWQAAYSFIFRGLLVVKMTSNIGNLHYKAAKTFIFYIYELIHYF